MNIVALYRFIRRAIDANADDFIMPLVENILPASTYDALDFIKFSTAKSLKLSTPSTSLNNNSVITLLTVPQIVMIALSTSS